MKLPENKGYSYRERVEPDDAGRTVVEQLARRHPHGTPEEWTHRIEAGEVERAGRRALARDVLRAGDELVWHRPAWTEPPVPADVAVLHEDADLLVVHKPAGLPTIPGGGFLAHTLLTMVRLRDEAWTPMHRLGRGTSGLVLFARTAAARSVLQQAFRTRAVEKLYLGLATGVLAPQRVRAPIGLVPYGALGELHAATPSGKPSESVVEACEPRGDATLARVRLVTGRPHQIRIHLAFAGHPLVGDPLYAPGGVPRPDCVAVPGDVGYLLHAWRLSLAHPATGAPLAFEAPPPEGLR